MPKYKATHEGYVIRDGDTKIAITDSPEYPNTNPDYLAYKDWLAAGNTPEPADPLPVVVPQAISRAQGKAVLIQQGLWAAVLAYVNAVEDPTEKALAEVALNDTQEWRRDSPFLTTAAAALGITEEQMDEMFVAASQVSL